MRELTFEETVTVAGGVPVDVELVYNAVPVDVELDTNAVPVDVEL